MKKNKEIQMRKLIAGFFIAATLISSTSCSQKPEVPSVELASTELKNENSFKLTKLQFSSSEMKLGKLETKEFHQVVRATGMIDVPPENRVNVSTYFGGTVQHIRLLPGERVKKGQVLFTLENPDYVQMQQEYLETKGQLTFLKSDFERQKNLVQDNVTSQKNYLKSEADYTVAKVKLESLAKKLILMGIDPKSLRIENIRSTIEITSPISGYVTQVNIARGAFLSPSQSAITIVDTDHLHLELNIFEKDLPKVKIGQPIQFKLQEDHSKKHNATVYLVNQTVHVENRTVGVHGHLTDEGISSKFNPGMYVEADIFTTTELNLALPQEALVEMDGKYFALVLVASSQDSFTFLKKEVKTGSINNGYVEILNFDALSDTSEILVKGAFNLITE